MTNNAGHVAVAQGIADGGVDAIYIGHSIRHMDISS
jgi:hypothetical protein